MWCAAAAFLIIISGCGESPQPADEEDERSAPASDESEEPAEPRADENATFCDIVDRSISKRDCDDLRSIEGQVKRGAAAFNVPSPMKRDKREFVTLVVDRRTPDVVAAIDEGQNASEAMTENAMDLDATMNASEPVEAAAGDSANAVAADENAVAPIETEAAPEPSAAPVPPRETAARETAARDGRQPASDRPRATLDTADGDPAAPTPRQHVDPLRGDTATLTPKVGRYMSADLSGDGFEIRRLTPRAQEIPPGNQARWQWEVTALESGKHTLTLVTVVEGKVGGVRYPLSRTFSVKTVDVGVSLSDRVGGTLDAVPTWIKRVTLVLVAVIGLLAAFFRLRIMLRGRASDEEIDEGLEDAAAEDEGGGNSKSRRKGR